MKRRMIGVCLVLLLVLAGGLGGSALTQLVMAESGQSVQIPQVINYQGFLTDKATDEPLNGSVNITFSLYSGADSTDAPVPIWTETHENLLLDMGKFNVLLGSITPLVPGVFTGATYLGISIGTEEEMVPRIQLGSVPYAVNADTLDGIDSTGFSVNTHTHDSRYVEENQPDGVTTAMIQNDAVTADKVSFNYAGSSSQGGSAFDSDLLDGLDSSQFMRSDGDITTTGSLSVGGTIEAAQVTYPSPQTRYLTVGTWTFHPINSDSAQVYSLTAWSGAYTDKENGILAAPVSLPYGAVVTQIRFSFRSLHAPAASDGIVVKFAVQGAGDPQTLIETDAAGLSDYGSDSKTVNLNQTIDKYQYLIIAQFPRGYDGVGLSGVEITYQVSEIR